MHVWDAGAGCVERTPKISVDEFREILISCICDRCCGWIYTRAVKKIVEGIDLLRDEVGAVCGRRDIEFAIGVF